MTGYQNYNYEAFNSAAELLRDARHSVINPAENFDGDTTRPRWTYIDKSVDQIQGLAKYMYSSGTDCLVSVLDGWYDSAGACLEVALAHELGLPVYELNCVFDPHWETDCRLIPGKNEAHPEVSTTDALREAALREAMERLKRRKVFNDDPIDTLQETRIAEGFADAGTIKPAESFPPDSVRAATLDEAKRLICGDRNNQYGPPGKDFNRAAQALTSLGFGKEGRDGSGCEVLDDHDVAVIMIVLKLSRLMWSSGKRDSWIDVAGYAACGAEVAGAK
jgi:hypothetical protein